MINLHLAAISADVAAGRHAALLLDQAGWHLSTKLAVPDNITIVPLPPKCPELNAQENVWQGIVTLAANGGVIAIEVTVRKASFPDLHTRLLLPNPKAIARERR
jgi:hypothetical protein